MLVLTSTASLSQCGVLLVETFSSVQSAYHQVRTATGIVSHAACMSICWQHSHRTGARGCLHDEMTADDHRGVNNVALGAYTSITAHLLSPSCHPSQEHSIYHRMLSLAEHQQCIVGQLQGIGPIGGYFLPFFSTFGSHVQRSSSFTESMT